MSDRPELMTVSELARKAVEAGIYLGKNPVRTLHYYKSFGLLRPWILQDGAVRRAMYSEDNLVTLRLIEEAKSKGLRLRDIRKDLDQSLYLSDSGRNFIARFKTEYPDSAFSVGSAVTREEIAFLLHRAFLNMLLKDIPGFLNEALVLADGRPAIDSRTWASLIHPQK